MSMVTLGIDPGLDGALVLYDVNAATLEVFDVPTLALTRNGKNKREIDHYALARIIDDIAGRYPRVAVCLEQVGAMPEQGVSSVFSFGKTYGVILGICAAHFLPILLVPPRVWKAALKVPKAKDGARARASELFPRQTAHWRRVKDADRAEAAMLALYGARSGLAAPILPANLSDAEKVPA